MQTGENLFSVSDTSCETVMSAAWPRYITACGAAQKQGGSKRAEELTERRRSRDAALGEQQGGSRRSGKEWRWKTRQNAPSGRKTNGGWRPHDETAGMIGNPAGAESARSSHPDEEMIPEHDGGAGNDAA